MALGNGMLIDHFNGKGLSTFWAAARSLVDISLEPHQLMAVNRIPGAAHNPLSTDRLDHVRGLESAESVDFQWVHQEKGSLSKIGKVLKAFQAGGLLVHAENAVGGATGTDY